MRCPYCQSENTHTYYNAKMPNILSACSESMHENVKTYPIEAKLCNNCYLGFNSTRLNSDQLKEIYTNYLYISPASGIGHTKYVGMIETLKKYYSKEDVVVEIGCSEGYLLNKLKDEGYKNLIGVEPGPQAEVATKSGFEIITDYFDENTMKGRKVNGFFLMHVFEHFENPFVFLDVMKNQLSPNGKIIIEVPDFGGYHHQHLYFYNLPFFRRLCNEKSLKIVDYIIEKDAMRVVLVLKENNTYPEKEITITARDISERAKKIHSTFLKKINMLNNFINACSGKKVVWWGAGSSSVISLNQLDEVTLNSIEVIDGDKQKWDCFIPGTNLKVHSFFTIKDKKVECMVIASSLCAEIKKTMEENNITADKLLIYGGV